MDMSPSNLPARCPPREIAIAEPADWALDVISWRDPSARESVEEGTCMAWLLAVGQCYKNTPRQPAWPPYRTCARWRTRDSLISLIHATRTPGLPPPSPAYTQSSASTSERRRAAQRIERRSAYA